MIITLKSCFELLFLVLFISFVEKWMLENGFCFVKQGKIILCVFLRDFMNIFLKTFVLVLNVVCLINSMAM